MVPFSDSDLLIFFSGLEREATFAPVFGVIGSGTIKVSE